MTIVRVDPIHPLKMEAITPADAFKEALYMDALGWELQSERFDCESRKTQKIIGALLNTLTEKGILTEQEIVDILDSTIIKYASDD